MQGEAAEGVEVDERSPVSYGQDAAWKCAALPEAFEEPVDFSQNLRGSGNGRWNPAANRQEEDEEQDRREESLPEHGATSFIIAPLPCWQLTDQEQEWE